MPRNFLFPLVLIYLSFHFGFAVTNVNCHTLYPFTFYSFQFDLCGIA